MALVRMAQYGTKHPHASGKLKAMLQDLSIELVGVYEEDPQQLAKVKDEEAYQGLHWLSLIHISEPTRPY